MRTFSDTEAARAQVPLLFGLMGPSGGGKTYSALRLATGIQRITGGDIFVIDTEARRSLHYADDFSFRHLEFVAPFAPSDYLAAIEHCVERGAKTIVIDSMSHEHEGPGGLLEMHDAELDRIAGQDWKKRERVKMLAWAKPKAERRRLINTILQLGCNLICCFRAKEKLKMVRGQEPEKLGWMPIAGPEFLYEMTACALLMPGANGVPEWNPGGEGERQMVKLPHQFREILKPGAQIDEEMGAAMARWASPQAALLFPRGDYKGCRIDDESVPTEYLMELRGKTKAPEWVEALTAELDRRAVQ